jgi:prepilin-type N-terminal cleavage/methylation domain-containing protein
MTPRQPVLRSTDEGFTLVEVLVTMLIAVVVLFAILQSGQFLQRTTAASSRLTGAQEDSRRIMRDLTQEARQAADVSAGTAAAPLVALSRSSLVFATVLEAAGGSMAGWVRYCATPDGRLLRGQRTVAPTAGEAASACGAAGAGWAYGTVLDGALVDGARVFSFTASATYAGAGCPQQPPTASVPNPPPCLPPVDAVTGVGIRLAISDRSAEGPRTVVTRGALSFRNRPQQ